jgi:hypothetical protein
MVRQTGTFIKSWMELREKFLNTFQGFRTDSNAASDLFNCKQHRDEPLLSYYKRFLISHAIEGLREGQLYTEFVRHRPRTLRELYASFEDFGRPEVQHYKMLESQR